MADDLRKLLNHIVLTYVVREELVGIDLEATASDRGADIESDKRRAIQRETHRANGLAQAFSRGLARAYQCHLARVDTLVLDDRDRSENEMADALIRFLVCHDLASSRSEETVPRHYRYHITVDWTRLAAVAREAGVDLAQALRRASA